MMFEIGSEFWTGSTPLDGDGVGRLMPNGMDARYTLCGRTALELVLRDALQCFPVRSAYLPSYCCHTMIEPFVAKGIEVVFYNVFFTDTGIDIAFDDSNDCDMVFLMDYFGFRNQKTFQIAENQCKRGKRVIYDATHSMFCTDMDYRFCQYVFGSFRKWFGVNGGFCAKRGQWVDFPALKNNGKYTKIRNSAFAQKKKFIAGEFVEKELILQAFAQAEEQLETDYNTYGPDEESVKILETVNVDYICQKRRENAAYIIDGINEGDKSIVRSPYTKIGTDDCPLFVPLWVQAERRAGLRKNLIDSKMYFPVHWPVSSLHSLNDISQQIYNTELSFVCDQRYSKEDIIRAIKTVRSF